MSAETIEQLEELVNELVEANKNLTSQLEKPFNEQIRAKDKWIDELLKENRQLRNDIFILSEKKKQDNLDSSRT